MNRVYGIDLGTTYSCIAYVDEMGNPKIIDNMDGQQTTPSVVFFEGENVVVGEHARNSARLHADRIVEAIKRQMGTDHKVFIDEKEFRPEEISALILKKVVKDAEAQVGPIEDVVITCPAYFNVGEREATRQAGVIAGLNVVEILNEPTAAAIAYGFRTQETGTLVVYDLGGGTFDVTVIRIENGEYRVIATGGSKELGGKDWDARIVTYLAEEWQKEHGSDEDPLQDPDTLQELWNEAERLKKSLSQRTEVSHVVRHNGKSARVQLTRAKFNELTEVLLDQTIDRTRHTLDVAAKKEFAQYDKFLLVGGLSRMPQVIERLRSEFGIEPEFNRPDFAVAEGAAFHGQIKHVQAEVDRVIQEQAVGDNEARKIVGAQFGLPASKIEVMQNISIINITSHSFGIVVYERETGKKLSNVIISGTEVPASITRSDFGTLHANQPNLEIQIYENQSRDPILNVPENGLLGTAVMDLPPNLPANSPVEISFDLDSSGLLNVRALLVQDGREVKTSIQTSSVMTSDQLAQAVERSQGIAILS